MHSTRSTRFAKLIVTQTAFPKLLAVFVACWLLFSYALFLSERGIESSQLRTYGDALYWGVAAFSTAGIAAVPESPLSRLIGGLWIVIGSVLFFGTIVSVVTAFFMRPLQRPKRKVVDAIVGGLEQLDELSNDEQNLLESEIDALFAQIHKQRQKNESQITSNQPDPGDS